MEQKSFQVHTVPVFPAILASLHPASGAMPTSCCFQDRKGKHRSLLCAATRPPATSPTSAAHPKLARASTGPRLSLQQGLPLQPSSAVQREAPTPQFLLWISFSITPASPLPSIITTPTHTHTARQEAIKASLPVEKEKTDPLCSPLPILSVHGGTWSTPPPSPLEPQKLENTPTSSFSSLLLP